MPLVHDSEMEAFAATIIDAGFEVADFSVIELEDKRIAKGPQPIVTTVTVQRISVYEYKTYIGGHLTKWLSEFEADLNAGKFGQP